MEDFTALEYIEKGARSAEPLFAFFRNRFIIFCAQLSSISANPRPAEKSSQTHKMRRTKKPANHTCTRMRAS